MKGKKMLLMCLSILMFLGMVGGLRLTANAAMSGDYEYSSHGDSVWIDKYVGSDKNLTIPSKINGKEVNRIEDEAFAYCNTLESLTVPGNVKYIGEGAFANCKNLRSITILDGIANIGDYAFAYCKNLSSINIPENGMGIGTRAFYLTEYYRNSKNWKNNALYIGDYLIEVSKKVKGDYTIGNETKYIAAGAFLGCKNLVSITIPEGIKNIPSETFNTCTKLKEINLPESIESVGIIRKCSELKTINYNGTIEEWKKFGLTYDEDTNNQLEVYCTDGYYVQLSYQELENYKYSSIDENKIKITEYRGYQYSVIIPNQIDGKIVEGIGEKVFSSPSRISNIKIPSTVTYIGEYAFAWCSNLLEITIPSSVNQIGENAFAGCDDLTAIYYQGTMEQWKKIDIKDNNEILESVQIYCSDGVINESKEEEYEYRTLNDGTIEIKQYKGKQANVEIPSEIEGKKVTSIASGAFDGLKFLRSVVIPNSVTEMGEYVFEDCIYLEKVTLPNTIKYISSFLFKNCVSLEKIEIPDSVEVIKEEAFFGCYALDTIKIPNNVQKISGGVFSRCDNLTEIEIPSSVTYINESVLAYCDNLKNITIYGNIENIPYRAFQYCGNLESITIPANVTEISEEAFNKCVNLEQVNYKGTQAQWKKITIGTKNEVLSDAKINCIDGNLECEHIFDTGKLISKPTCTKNGKKIFTCTKCGESKEEVVKATGHNFGNNQPKCSICGTANPNYKEEVVVTKLAATTLKSVKAGNKSIKVTWTKVSKVDGYQIQYTTDSKFKKSIKTITVKNQKTTSYTINGLKANQKYYVRVCTYKTQKDNSKLTSKWSKVKNATTPVQKPKATTLKSVKAGKKSIKVTWKKTAKVNGYQILLATNSKFTKNKKTITISKQSTVSKNVTKLKAKTKYYVKVRTYDVQTIKGKKINVYSEWSKVKNVKTK